MGISNLTLKTFQQFVNEQAETFVAYLSQAIPNITPNFISGSPELAFFQEMATEFFYLQALVNQVALAARLTTCGVGPGLSGSSQDVDTFVNDFGLYRLPATYDTGQITFSTNSANANQVLIPAGQPQTPGASSQPAVTGAIVQDPTGLIQYQVIVDTTNSNYNSSLNAYVLPASTLSVSVTAQALTAGVTSNVNSNILSILSTGIPGISAVTNPNPIDNAVNAESDAALKARFILYIASLSRATVEAIDFAVESVPGVVRYIVLENTNPAGQTQYGFFTVYVDDGTGSPSSTLISNVSNAVNAYRGATIQFAVEAPNVTDVTIAVTVLHNPNTSLTNSQIATNIQTALINYINQTLSFGNKVYFSQLYDIIFNATQSPVGTYTDEAILTVSSLTLNGETSDLTIGSSYIPIATTDSVTVTVD